MGLYPLAMRNIPIQKSYNFHRIIIIIIIVKIITSTHKMGTIVIKVSKGRPNEIFIYYI